jgi:TolB-like protein
VVVLPFLNLTGDSHIEYLADGVTEQLTDALAQIPSLRVVARTSAFQFQGKGVDIREIGRRVDADAVVEGSLQYLNGKLLLTAQVNRTADGYHILSRRFEGAIPELGRLENEKPVSRSRRFLDLRVTRGLGLFSFRPVCARSQFSLGFCSM